jgi:hypothetical protein
MSFVLLLNTDARKYTKDTSHPTPKLKLTFNADVHVANTDWVQGGQL